MTDIGFDELDVAIVDAIRTSPRASWSDLGQVLGVAGSTVSRRWARMESCGAAWVTAHPSGSATPACALVEIDCVPGSSSEVARALAADPEAATVKVTSGTRDVMVLAQSPNLDALSQYLLGLVPRIAGIARTRSHVVTRATLEASRWREGALDPTQQRRLDPAETSDSATKPLDGADHRILDALHADGRMPLERLAERVGIGPLAVGRRLARMRAAGLMTLRCDASRVLSGRSVSAVYFGSLDVQDLRSAEQRIRSLPGVRASSFVAGPFNVVIDAWVHSTAEVHALEWRMSQELPELRIQDRSVVLQMTKLLGRLLDDQGRAIGLVPLLHTGAQR